MKKGEDCIRPYRSTIVLLALLLVLSCCSLFVGVIDLTPGELLAGNFEQLEIFIISRLPRLLAILCTGIGMSVAGLIMNRTFFSLVICTQFYFYGVGSNSSYLTRNDLSNT
mgnify:CR=1 FL=1